MLLNKFWSRNEQKCFYGDIAEIIKTNYADYADENIEALKGKVSGVLTRDVKKTDGLFTRVPNGKKNKGKISYKRVFIV